MKMITQTVTNTYKQDDNKQCCFFLPALNFAEIESYGSVCRGFFVELLGVAMDIMDNEKENEENEKHGDAQTTNNHSPDVIGDADTGRQFNRINIIEDINLASNYIEHRPTITKLKQ